MSGSGRPPWAPVARAHRDLRPGARAAGIRDRRPRPRPSPARASSTCSAGSRGGLPRLSATGAARVRPRRSARRGRGRRALRGLQHGLRILRGRPAQARSAAVELLRRHHPGSAVIGAPPKARARSDSRAAAPRTPASGGSRRLHSSPVSTRATSRAIRRQPPQLGTRAWPGQVAYRLDLHRGHRAEAGQRGEDVRTIARRRSGPPPPAPLPPTRCRARLRSAAPGVIVAELQSRQGRGGPRLLEVGPKGLGDRGRLGVDAKTIRVEARPATSSTSGSVRSSRRQWRPVPSRSTRRQALLGLRPAPPPPWPPCRPREGGAQRPSTAPDPRIERHFHDSPAAFQAAPMARKKIALVLSRRDHRVGDPDLVAELGQEAAQGQLTCP